MKVFRLDDIRFSKSRYAHKKPKGFRFRVFNRLTPIATDDAKNMKTRASIKNKLPDDSKQDGEEAKES